MSVPRKPAPQRGPIWIALTRTATAPQTPTMHSLVNLTQWTDTDGDGYGTTPTAPKPMRVRPKQVVHLDVFGCLDGDGDGASDANDLWPPTTASGLTATAMATVMSQAAPMVMLVPTKWAPQPPMAPLGVQTRTAMDGLTAMTPSPNNAANTPTATAMDGR